MKVLVVTFGVIKKKIYNSTINDFLSRLCKKRKIADKIRQYMNFNSYKFLKFCKIFVKFWLFIVYSLTNCCYNNIGGDWAFYIYKRD